MKIWLFVILTVPVFAADADIWQRTKECAAQAEKVTANYRVSADEFITWTNHYSPKYDRCFVEIRHMLRAVAPNLKHDGIMYTGEASWVGTELQDAFERTRLAFVSTDTVKPRQCLLNGEVAECAKAREFIAERLGN